MINKIKKSLIIVVLGIYFCILCGFDENEQKVYDNADLLTDIQEQELQRECIRIGEKYKTDIIILTTNDSRYMSSEQYAEKFVVENDIGYDDNPIDKACIVYLIDMDDREVYLYLGGVTQYYLESKWDGMTDTSVSYLRSQNYYEACTRFLSDTEYYIGKKYDEFQKKYQEKWNNFNGNYTSFKDEYIKEPFFAFLKNPFYCVLIALGVALISIAIMAQKNKSKMTANGETYMDRKKFRMHRQLDHFIRTTTVKQKVKSSSGGSHSHRSGRSHGGGGKRF